MLVMIVQNSLGRDRVDDIVVFACDGKLSVDVILAACVVAVVSFVDFVVVAWVDSVAGVSCTVLSLVGVVDVCGFVLVDFVIHADVPCAVGSLSDVVDMMSAAMTGCVVVGLVDCEIVSVVSE